MLQRAARGGARGRGRRGLPAGGARRRTSATRRSVTDWPEAPALRIPGRRDLARVRLRTQRRLPARPPRQRGALQVPDRRATRTATSRSTATRRAACCIACCGFPGIRSTLHAICVHLGLRESHRRHQLALLRRDHPRACSGRCAADRRRRLQRLAPAAHRILEQTRGTAGGLRAFAAAARRRPSRRAFRCCRSTASTCATPRVHAPLPLPRRPWSHLSDHAPLAAEIGL